MNISRATSPSLRKSINAHCKNCIYDRYSGIGTWRQQVAACTSNSCALFDVRPMPIFHINLSLIALKNSEFEAINQIQDYEESEHLGAAK
ncbi:MAG: hypothetical protein H7A06_05445 [Pseudomonadales bacterium]|nr:hypothetical protein [Pseudomonadales bacterium]